MLDGAERGSPGQAELDDDAADVGKRAETVTAERHTPAGDGDRFGRIHAASARVGELVKTSPEAQELYDGPLPVVEHDEPPVLPAPAGHRLGTKYGRTDTFTGGSGPVAGATGVHFAEYCNGPPNWRTPMTADVAVADLNPLPANLMPTSAASAWTSGWPDGGPQWVAGASESWDSFKHRIITSLQSANNTGHVVFVYYKNGFFTRNSGIGP